MGPTPIHVLMRFSDKLFAIGNVIERHAAVLERHGAVWIAKIGRPLGGTRISSINTQIAADVASYLFLYQRKLGSHELWRSELLEVRASSPSAHDPCVPSYYADCNMFAIAETWFKVESFRGVGDRELDRLVTLSSRQPIIQTLTTSTAALFIIGQGKAAAPRESGLRLGTHRETPDELLGSDDLLDGSF